MTPHSYIWSEPERKPSVTALHVIAFWFAAVFGAVFVLWCWVIS